MSITEHGHYIDGVTYPADLACQIVELVGARPLEDLKTMMGTEHLLLSEKKNRVYVLNEFARSEPESEIKALINSRLQTKEARDSVHQFMNNPTFEAFKVLEIAGLPTRGSHVFSSTATANSGNDDAVTTALKILGVTDGIEFQRTSTVNMHTMQSAVSCQAPKNPPVSYDRHKPPTEWHLQAYDLALQFYNYSNPDSGGTITVTHMHDKIYHWGCINQCYLISPLQHEVSSWAMHEKWNVVMTTAMMWHALMTLKPGGQLCLKTRIFKRAETLGLVALISAVFDNVQMVDNPRQVCTFVSVVYSGMTSDLAKRMQVANTLRRAMDQSPEHIFYCDVQRDNPQCLQTIRLAEQHRSSMLQTRAKVNTLFLMGLYCIKLQLDGRSRRRQEILDLQFSWEILLDELVIKYGYEKGNLFYEEFQGIVSQLNGTQRCTLKTILNSRWMKDNF